MLTHWRRAIHIYATHTRAHRSTAPTDSSATHSVLLSPSIHSCDSLSKGSDFWDQLPWQPPDHMMVTHPDFFPPSSRLVIFLSLRSPPPSLLALPLEYLLPFCEWASENLHLPLFKAQLIAGMASSLAAQFSLAVYITPSNAAAVDRLFPLATTWTTLRHCTPEGDICKISERRSLRLKTSRPESTFQICERCRGEEPCLACRHQRHRSSDLETPDLELTLFLFVSQSGKRGRVERGGTGGGLGRSSRKALDLAPQYFTCCKMGAQRGNEA